MQTLNGEDWPPLMKDAPVEMIYIGPVPDEAKYALGHSFFGNLPGLFMFATVWMREHNRVCDILKKVHPDWDDERLFQTTKLVTLGKTKNIFCMELFRKPNYGCKTDALAKLSLTKDPIGNS